MNKKIKYPSWESFPETIKYVDNVYYRIKGDLGRSPGDGESILPAQRYTDNPSGRHNGYIPLYLDANGVLLWDGPNEPCLIDIADINKAIPILVPSVWIVFDEVTKGMFVFYTERAAECYKNKHWRTTGHSTTMKEYKINVSK